MGHVPQIKVPEAVCCHSEVVLFVDDNPVQVVMVDVWSLLGGLLGYHGSLSRYPDFSWWLESYPFRWTER